jgi:lipopolysaccharide/colanic/teichoic acid biosynthesis glycosyltransferase
MKRLLDIVVAASLLIALAPVFIVVALLVAIALGRPLVFRHRRPGLAGVPFELLKFRTMSDAVDGSGRLLPDDRRLGRIGRLLRQLSLDELPQLINVLRGDMSLVGPRPLLMQYLGRYSPAQARRHDVKPGITGWAQINGRNALSWEDRFALDVWYVDNRCLSLDLKILALTVLAVVRREGISEQGRATMSEFIGATAHDSERTCVR